MRTVFITLKTCPLPHQLEVSFSYADDGTFTIQKIVAGTWEARQAYEQSVEHPLFTQQVQELCEAQVPPVKNKKK